jgi:hypothetical protein
MYFIIVWTHAQTLLLIETYRRHYKNFQNPAIKKKEVWNIIAAEMNNTVGGSQFNAANCDKKWHNMEGRYKQKRDSKGKTGRSGGKQWLYYEQLDEIIGCKASSASVSEVSHLKSTASQPLVSPPSDSSDEEVRNDAATASIQKSATDGRRCSKKMRRDCPPVWFEEFAKEHAENEKAAREERKQHYDKMEKAMQERISLMKKMTDLMSVWVQSTVAQQRKDVEGEE